jgi:hypothetical protein
MTPLPLSVLGWVVGCALWVVRCGLKLVQVKKENLDHLIQLVLDFLFLQAQFLTFFGLQNRQIVKEGATDEVKFTSVKIACRLKEFEREFF